MTPQPPVIHRLLGRVFALRRDEAATAVLMFAYSFLAMTAHNILRPITRAKFIGALGADDLPYVLLAAGLVIGLLMQGYSRAVRLLPHRSAIPITQAVIAAVLVLFWLLFRTGAAWVSVAFYIFGLVLGILLISQFWTLANDLYDARQAKRLFGFIGGGASLGGASGAGITALSVASVGTDNLLLVSAAVLAACAAVVRAIVGRQPAGYAAAAPVDGTGVGGGEAIRMLRRSRHLQLIALVIGFGALGSAIIDQQLSMAAESMQGADATDAITSFLAQVGFYLSLAGFAVQVGLTGLIHRSVGLGIALVILPLGLATTGGLILVTGALWAPAVARVLDTSLRYTIDRTTREVLFLPLPADVRFHAKPFVDVTVDRFAKALGALLLLLLIKPWGLGVTWPSLSYASLVIAALWIVMATRARAEYLRAFRRGIEAHALVPSTEPLNIADPATVEMLIEELASPDDRRVVYAVDMLELLDKRHLLTPLLLRHDSPAVRARALRAFDPARSTVSAAEVERLLRDEDPDVRAAAVQALAALRRDGGAAVMRQLLADPDPRVAATAAVVLADSDREADVALGEATLLEHTGDARPAAVPARREAAAALARMRNPRLRRLLVPLLSDEDRDVAREAIRSITAGGPVDPVFVPGLIALLGHRTLKGAAREALVAAGDVVIAPLAHFLHDHDENPWVRRHIPATLALVPSQPSMNALVDALGDADGFLRFKVIEAIERLRRDHPALACPAAPLEALLVRETASYYDYLTLRHNLFERSLDAPGSLLVRALDDKLARTLDRIFRLLGLMHSPGEVAAARHAIEHGDRRLRAGALEYLDNVLTRPIRRRVMPILEDGPIEEKVRHANVMLRSRPRDLEETLVHLVHNDDPVVAATAIHFAGQRQAASLAGDFEFVVSHRRVADWHIVEAASWALAALRREERGRDQPLPVVELADRLRAIPLFDFVSVDELFRIAAAARQVRHEPGRELYAEGEHPGEVQFLLEGTVRLSDGQLPRDLGHPAALAFEEILAGTPVAHSVRAADRVTSLVLDRDHLLTLLSDSIELAQGLFRLLLQRADPRQWRLVQAPGTSEPAAIAAGPLQPLDKVRLLRQLPFFNRAVVSQLLDLAACTREVALEPPRVLLGPADDPSILHVVSGEVRLEGDGLEPIVAGAGSTFGMAETLAGVPFGSRAAAASKGLVLRLDRDALFDVLALHVSLLQGLFSALLPADRTLASPAAGGSPASLLAPGALPGLPRKSP